MNKGKSYLNLLKVFDIHDTMKNEWFIERYFKNIMLHILCMKSYCVKQKKVRMCSGSAITGQWYMASHVTHHHSWSAILY